MSKPVKWLLIAFVVWFAVTQPQQASAAVHKVVAFAGKAATSAATLVSSL